MKKFIVLLVFMFAARALFSQSLGQDGQVVDPEDLLVAGEIPPSLSVYPFQWVDLTDPSKKALVFSPDATGAGNNLDESVDNINLDMTFSYFGEKYTSASIVTNGLIAIGAKAEAETYRSLLGSNSYSPAGMPSVRLPNNLVAPFWVDIDFSNSDGYILHRTFKPEKNNKSFDHIVIQWDDAGLFNAYLSEKVSVTFQAVLFTEGGILFQYKTIDSGTLRETVYIPDPNIDIDDLSDYELIKYISKVAIGYEDITGVKGAEWDSPITAGMSLGNELVPDWASGTGGSFLDFQDGRDRRNNVTTSSGGGGCFLSHKKASQDR